MGGVPRILFCPPLYPPTTGGSQALFADLARLWTASGGESVVYSTAPTAGIAPVSLGGVAADPGDGDPVVGATGGLRVRRFPAVAAAAPRLSGKLLAALAAIGPRRWRAAIGFPHLLTRGYRAALRGAVARADGPFHLVVGGVLPHTHFLEPAVRFARRRRLPLVVIPLLHVGLRQRHPDRQILGPVAAPLLQAASRVIALTDAEVDPLRRLGVPSARIRRLPIALRRREAPGALDGLTSRHRIPPPYLLQAGALCEDKGTLVVIAAQERLVLRGCPAHLVLAGHTDARVRRALAALSPATRRTIHLITEPSTRDWDDAIAGAGVLVHPSRADAFGRVLLEAWRAGVPPVVADVGGPARLIRHGIDGLVVPADAPVHLAEAVESLVSNRHRSQEMGASGQERFRSDYTWATVFPRWSALFHDALQTSSPAGESSS
jgi:glycosyltransferase involved in cell wall biosynthesis